MRRLSLMVLLLSVLVAGAVQAEESSHEGNAFRRSGALLDASPQHRDMMLSVFAGIPYGYGSYYYGFPFSIGGRFYIPIVHNGFAPPINDEFGIEFGADLGFRFWSSVGLSVDVPVEALYKVHFTDWFAAYAKVGLVLDIGAVNACGPYSCSTIYVFPSGGLGAQFKISRKVVFRVEATYPGVRAGFGFDL